MASSSRDRRMLVCVALHSSGLGGAERSHIERALDLHEEGVETHTLLPSPDRGLCRELEKAGLTFTLLPASSWWIPDTSPVETQLQELVQPGPVSNYLEELLRIRPDIVVTISSVDPHAALAARLLGLPHVWILTELALPAHGLFPPVSHSEVGESIASLSDAVICVSRAVRTNFFGSLTDEEFTARGIDVIHNAPRLIADRSECGRAGIATGDPYTVGIIGNFSPAKGQKVAVEALHVLKQRGVPVRMIFFGDGPKNGEEALRQLAADRGVDDLIAFQYEGNRTTIFDIVDSVAVTSTGEGFSRVPFEAVFAGRPVVYADDGAITEFMVRDITGIPFAAGDPVTLADALVRLVDDPTLGAALVSAGREHLDRFCSSPPRGAAVRSVLEVAKQRRAITGGGTARQEALVPPLFLLRLITDPTGPTGTGQDTHRSIVRDELTRERDVLREERDWWFVQFHQLRSRRIIRVALWLAGLLQRLGRRRQR